MCSIDKNIDEVSRYFWYREYQKVSRHTRYQYREILVSRDIEVSSVSPIPTLPTPGFEPGPKSVHTQEGKLRPLAAQICV